MEREHLTECLSNFFTNSWPFSPDTYLQKLCALVSYYAADDFDEHLQKNFNKLYAALLDFDMIWKIAHNSPEQVVNLKENIDNIYERASEIDIAGLTLYVKKKAIAAGDFVLE